MEKKYIKRIVGVFLLVGLMVGWIVADFTLKSEENFEQNLENVDGLLDSIPDESELNLRNNLENPRERWFNSTHDEVIGMDHNGTIASVSSEVDKNITVGGDGDFIGTIFINNGTDISVFIYNQTTATFNLYNSTWDNVGDIISNVTKINGQFSDFNMTDFAPSFDSNISGRVSNFNMTDFQPSFDLNFSNVANNFINFSEFQTSFDLNLTLSAIQALGFDIDTSATANCTGNRVLLGNGSCMSIDDVGGGDFSMTDFQSSFDQNYSEVGYNKTDFLNSNEGWITYNRSVNVYNVTIGVVV